MFEWIKGKKIEPEGLKPPEPWPEPPADDDGNLPPEKTKEEMQDEVIRTSWEVLMKATVEDRIHWNWESEKETYYAAYTRDPFCYFGLRKKSYDTRPGAEYEFTWVSDGIVTTLGNTELEKKTLYDEIFKHCVRRHKNRQVDCIESIMATEEKG